jgi:hypothetical protein
MDLFESLAESIQFRYPQVRSSNFTKRAFLFSFHMPVRFFLMLVSFTGSMEWTW